MTRLGVCSMIIEPHVFEATLYVVKEPHPVFAPVHSHAQTSAPDMQYSSFSHVAIYPPAPRGISAVDHPHNNILPNSNLPQPKLAPFQDDFEFREPHSYNKSSAVPHSSSMSHGSHSMISRNNTRDETVHVQEDKSSSDPVIQMLATRAASNPNLKALMKVVASGEATPAELKEFQNHIDDLNRTLKMRNRFSQDPRGPSLSSIPPFGEKASMKQSRTSPPQLNNTGFVPSVHATHIPPIPAGGPFKQEPLPPIFAPYSQPVKSKSSASYKSEIVGVVFDIGGVGDRYSFPRLSILEYYPGGTQVVVSFLIIRKGSEAASKGYKDNVSYYQPVTMRLSSLQPRILEPLARIVAPPDEVRKYMDSVFEKMTQADNVFLATRLPRTSQSVTEKEEFSAPLEPNLVQTSYSPPHTLMPRVT